MSSIGSWTYIHGEDEVFFQRQGSARCITRRSCFYFTNLRPNGRFLPIESGIAPADTPPLPWYSACAQEDCRFDGTLFDTYPAIARAFKAALHDFGKDAASERIEGLARNSLGYCAATLAGEFSLDADAIGEKFNGRYSLIGLDAQPPFRGVKAVCEYICSFGGKNAPLCAAWLATSNRAA